ncbi:DUF5690 family protein [Fibrella aquatilis]|uniref:MFS transporter n=1 Tax=Fibrella aquatilis TaxID=2817059 RepID=A0A939G420_9BACT|nr:DUF5690 family protein [Fibrella aquatilis]MBO0929601.1 hypothetical protein [Fibrella aquatilis]
MKLLRHPAVFVLFGATAAFCTYTCMYAFRKGITAVTFEGMAYAGLSYKTWLIMAQVLGYALSKRMGVKVVSEVSAGRRAMYVLAFVAAAEVALLGFALVPAPWNIPFLLLNGLPLGMVYGVVLGFLEGRRQTDALVAGLTASFIFASGFVKTVALTIKADWGVSEFWLPFVTGALFVGPLLLSVFALSSLPPPTEQDRAQRTSRPPMMQADRRAFIRYFNPGLALLIAAYVLLTAFRDFRDNFGPEILKSVGNLSPALFTKTEAWVAVVLLVLMSLLTLVRDHWQAFRLINAVMMLAMITLVVSTYAFDQGWLSAGNWYLALGIGLYAAYVPLNGLYFERLVAAFRYPSTVGFVVTLADYYGYLGSVGILLYKNFGQSDLSYLDFLRYGAYALAGCFVLLMSASYRSMAGRYAEQTPTRYATSTGDF